MPNFQKPAYCNSALKLFSEKTFVIELALRPSYYLYNGIKSIMYIFLENPIKQVILNWENHSLLEILGLCAIIYAFCIRFFPDNFHMMLFQILMK